MPLTLAASWGKRCSPWFQRHLGWWPWLNWCRCKKAEDRTCLFVLLIIIKGGACGKSVITTNSNVKNNDIWTLIYFQHLSNTFIFFYLSLLVISLIYHIHHYSDVKWHETLSAMWQHFTSCFIISSYHHWLLVIVVGTILFPPVSKANRFWTKENWLNFMAHV